MVVFLKALGAFLLLPGIVSGVFPALIIFYSPWSMPRWENGIILIALGLVILLKCVWDFYAFGKGTLAHWSPPQRLVYIGLYRFVRNPMYLGVMLLVSGLALYFGSLMLLVYVLLLAVAFHLHVVKREEPWLAAQFPEIWSQYSAQVPRWLPRIR